MSSLIKLIVLLGSCGWVVGLYSNSGDGRENESSYQSSSEEKSTEHTYGRSLYRRPRYRYSWNVDHKNSKNNYGHSENRDGDLTEGNFFVHLPDGRNKSVDYFVKGNSGFVANVKYVGEAKFLSSEESDKSEVLKWRNIFTKDATMHSSKNYNDRKKTVTLSSTSEEDDGSETSKRKNKFTRGYTVHSSKRYNDRKEKESKFLSSDEDSGSKESKDKNQRSRYNGRKEKESKFLSSDEDSGSEESKRIRYISPRRGSENYNGRKQKASKSLSSEDSGSKESERIRYIYTRRYNVPKSENYNGRKQKASKSLSGDEGSESEESKDRKHRARYNGRKQNVSKSLSSDEDSESEESKRRRYIFTRRYNSRNNENYNGRKQKASKPLPSDEDSESEESKRIKYIFTRRHSPRRSENYKGRKQKASKSSSSDEDSESEESKRRNIFTKGDTVRSNERSNDSKEKVSKTQDLFKDPLKHSDYNNTYSSYSSYSTEYTYKPSRTDIESQERSSGLRYISDESHEYDNFRFLSITNEDQEIKLKSFTSESQSHEEPNTDHEVEYKFRSTNTDTKSKENTFKAYDTKNQQPEELYRLKNNHTPKSNEHRSLEQPKLISKAVFFKPIDKNYNSETSSEESSENDNSSDETEDTLESPSHRYGAPSSSFSRENTALRKERIMRGINSQWRQRKSTGKRNIAKGNSSKSKTGNQSNVRIQTIDIGSAGHNLNTPTDLKNLKLPHVNSKSKVNTQKGNSDINPQIKLHERSVTDYHSQFSPDNKNDKSSEEIRTNVQLQIPYKNKEIKQKQISTTRNYQPLSEYENAKPYEDITTNVELQIPNTNEQIKYDIKPNHGKYKLTITISQLPSVDSSSNKYDRLPKGPKTERHIEISPTISGHHSHQYNSPQIARHQIPSNFKASYFNEPESVSVHNQQGNSPSNINLNFVSPHTHRNQEDAIINSKTHYHSDFHSSGLTKYEDNVKIVPSLYSGHHRYENQNQKSKTHSAEDFYNGQNSLRLAINALKSYDDAKKKVLVFVRKNNSTTSHHLSPVQDKIAYVHSKPSIDNRLTYTYQKEQKGDDAQTYNEKDFPQSTLTAPNQSFNTHTTRRKQQSRPLLIPSQQTNIFTDNFSSYSTYTNNVPQTEVNRIKNNYQNNINANHKIMSNSFHSNGQQPMIPITTPNEPPHHYSLPRPIPISNTYKQQIAHVNLAKTTNPLRSYTDEKGWIPMPGRTRVSKSHMLGKGY